MSAVTDVLLPASPDEAVSAFGDGNFAVLAAVVISVAVFGMIGAGLGAALHNQLATVTAMLLYLYVLEPLISHIGALHSWTTKPPVAT